jgi:hypothetical protein
MATRLSKPISRRVRIVLDNRADARNIDDWVLTVYPDGIIGFRQYRCRKEYTVSVSRLLIDAILADELKIRKVSKKSRKRRG